MSSVFAIQLGSLRGWGRVNEHEGNLIMKVKEETKGQITLELIVSH